MQEFDVPMLDPMSTTGEAFSRMLETGRSGVAIQVGDELRLLPFQTLVDAVDYGAPRLVDIGKFEAVTLLTAGVPTHAHLDALNKSGVNFGMVGVGYKTVRLLSRSEQYAGIYLTPPQVLKCRNPTTPHYYPPFKRIPPGRTTCSQCQFPLP